MGVLLVLVLPQATLASGPLSSVSPDELNIQSEQLAQVGLPASASQRVQHLGQTGGLVTDFALQSDLVFVPEGEALTILRQEDERVVVLSRVSPNQGRIQGLALSQGSAFLITPTGLAAIDVQDPQQPQVLSFLPGGGETIKVAGEFAFVPARAAGLRIVNIANPRHPKLVGTFPIAGRAVDVDLDPQANLAYVAADDGGLRVINISAPDLPHEVASAEFADGVQQLRLDGESLYLSSGDRILLLDVSRPSSPVRLGTYAPPRESRRARMIGDTVYVADLDGGLKVLNTSDMSRPKLVYGETEGASYDIVARGNRLYVADGQAGVRILNVNNPARPELVSQLPLGGVAQGLDLWEDMLLVAAGEAGLYVVQIANERAPTVIGHLDTEGHARDVKAGQSVAYVADGPGGLVVISLLTPSEPVLRGALYVPGEAQALGTTGTFLFIAAGDGGLQIVDAIRPSAPFLVGSLALPEGQRTDDLSVVNKRVYLAVQDTVGDETGVAIADVGFRSRPTILSRVSGPGTGVAVLGTDVVAVEGTELMLVDARASSGPVLAGTYRPLQGAGGLDRSSDTLYLTTRADGPQLTLLDVSAPGFPQEMLNIGLTAYGGRVQVVDSQVYVATGKSGLHAFKLQTADPAEISLTSDRIIYDPMDSFIRLDTFAADRDLVYGAGQEGWAITDVRNPQLPQPIARVQTGAPVYGLARSEGRFYATSATRGLLVYQWDKGNLQSQPRLLAEWAGTASLRDVVVHGDYLYVTDHQVGLQVLGTTATGQPYLLQTLPLDDLPERLVPLPEPSNHAYFLSPSRGGLGLLDLGDPAVGLRPLGQFPAEAWEVQVEGPYGFALDGGRFSVWDVSDGGANPSEVTAFQINGTELLLVDDLAFVGSDAGHVSVIDIESPTRPRVIAMMGHGTAVRGMVHREGELVVGLNRELVVGQGQVGQLRVWSLEDVSSPVETGTLTIGDTIAAMQQSEDERWIVTVGDNLVLIDATLPATLTVESALPLPARAICLTIDDDLAYVGTETGLVVVGGMESGRPAIRATLSMDEPVHDLVVHRGRAYLATGSAGGAIVDLADPAAPRQIASMPSPTGGTPRSLSLTDEQLWVVWDGWVSWLDVSQPQSGPTEIPLALPAGLHAADIAVIGDSAYLVDGTIGLVAMDISDPAAPTLIESLETPGQAHAVAVTQDGAYAHIADGECGVRVVSLGPGAMREVGYWHSGYALDVAALDDEIYLADIGELIALRLDLSAPPSSPPAPQFPEPGDDALFYPVSEHADTIEATLQWGPPASRCDPLTYDLYLGVEEPPPLVASGLVSSSFRASGLERQQTYYWQVLARDRQGDTAAGSVWRFHIRTSAHRPEKGTPEPAPELAPAEQDQVASLIGILLAAGVVAFILWWVYERQGA